MSQIDFLTSNGVKIRQTADVPNFTSDAIVLANFVTCKSMDTVIDAGCGGGVISLVINDRHKPCRIIAVDIDPRAADLARDNFALNNMTNAEAYAADIRAFHKHSSPHSVDSRSPCNFANIADVIVCNPPYFGTGRKSKNSARAAARHNATLSLPELADAATRLIKYGGILYMCYPIGQITLAIQVLENRDFRVKEIKILPHLVLIRAKKSKGSHLTKVTYGGYA